ncbi:hypothetical protein AAT17_10505 [Nonlabens sp. MIC269]|uniref:hypothetical protein n=1 Tax=Nonlabens sp. MIC269 TaxID=1476901 RepID=UPI00071FE060|nr:hypothetical protein [Nonlabens sp. MIC269]ALM21636.1 hypothetical protein AAT17_10505 [Nonlabens sp. MIC269]
MLNKLQFSSVLLIITSLLISDLSIGQSYDTTNFNSPTGRQVINTGGNDEEGRRVLKRSDGTILFGVKTSPFVGDLRYEIYCLNQDGTRCNNFGTNGYVDNLGLPVVVRSIRDFSLEPGSDKIILAVGLQFESRPALIRLNADGSFDTTFGSNGSTVLPWPSNASMNAGGFYTVLCLTNNSGYILSYSYTPVGGDSNQVYYKLDSSGILDTNFGNNGLLELISNTTDFYSRAIVQDSPTSFLVTLEEYDSNNQVANSFVQKYDFSGNLVTAFGNNGNVSLVSAVLGTSMDVSSTGKIVVYGTYPPTFSSSGKQELNIAVLNTDGSIDTSFSNNSNGVNNYEFVTGDDHIANDVIFQPNGKLIVMYRASPNFAGYNSLLFRLNTDGSVDTTFSGTPGSPPNNFSLNASSSISEFFDMKLVDDGSLFATGFGNSFAPTFFDAWLVKVLIPGAALNTQDEESINMEVFPVPAKDELTIQSDQAIDQVIFYDMMGRELGKFKPENDIIRIDKLGVKNSMVMAHIYSDGSIISKKILIE